MKLIIKFWYIIPLLIFVILIGFLCLGLNKDPRVLQSVHLGKELPKFILPILGKSAQTLNSQSWRGKWFLLNVWASWCTSCRQEQVFLLHLAQQGIKIYGLNYQDNSNSAQRWLKKWGNPYHMVLVDSEGDVGIDLGVYGVPETYLIDASGVILYRYAGILNAKIWRKYFLTKIASL